MGMRARIRRGALMDWAYVKGHYQSGATLGPGARRARRRLMERRAEQGLDPKGGNGGTIMRMTRQIRRAMGLL